MKPSNTVVLRQGHWPAFVATLLLFTGVLAACDAMNPVEEITFENPVDPSGDAFVSPTTTITGGPSDGSTVSTEEVTFTWEGNDNATLFQVRITGGEWDGTWGQWDTHTSLLIGFLDEVGYTFEVRSGYPSDSGDPVEIDETPESVSFTVDAMQGPALRMTPTRLTESVNNTFSIEIIAEDVVDLTMTQITIRFNSSFIQYADSYTYGSFLTGNGGSILEFPSYVDQGAGVVEFNFGIAGANPPGVSGTGTIMTVFFRGTSSGSSDMTFGAANTLLRNHLNQGITITAGNLRGARIIIQ